jgi:hypothetical protein
MVTVSTTALETSGSGARILVLKENLLLHVILYLLRRTLTNQNCIRGEIKIRLSYISGSYRGSYKGFCLLRDNAM